MRRITTAIATERALDCPAVEATLRAMGASIRPLPARTGVVREAGVSEEAQTLAAGLSAAAAAGADLLVARPPRRPEDAGPALRRRLEDAPCLVWLASPMHGAAPPRRVLCAGRAGQAAEAAAAVAAAFARPTGRSPELSFSWLPEDEELEAMHAGPALALGDARDAARGGPGLPALSPAAIAMSAPGPALARAAAMSAPDLLVAPSLREEMSAALALVQRRAPDPAAPRPAAPPAGVILVSPRAAARLARRDGGARAVARSPAARMIAALVAGVSIAGATVGAMQRAALPARPV